MLKENLLHQAMATAPGALLAHLAPSPVGAAQRRRFTLARILPERTEPARRAPAQQRLVLREEFMRCKWPSREMQSRGSLWEPHGKAEGPCSCIPQWQPTLSAPSPHPLGPAPVGRQQAGTKKFQLSSPRLLLCVPSPLRPSSCGYLRTQILFKKVFANLTATGRALRTLKAYNTKPEHAHVCIRRKANAKHLTKFRQNSHPLGQ